MLKNWHKRNKCASVNPYGRATGIAIFIGENRSSFLVRPHIVDINLHRKALVEEIKSGLAPGGATNDLLGLGIAVTYI